MTELSFYSNRVWIPEGWSHHPKVTHRTTAPNQGYHSHEFCEITWFTEGAVEHWVNDEAVVLDKGDVVLLRPGHVHGYRPTIDGTLIYNVMFIDAALHHLANEYFGGKPEFWAEQDRPRVCHISELKIGELCTAFEALQAEPRQRLHLDRFLLNTLAILDISPPASDAEQLPPWLIDGMRVLQSPEILTRGMEAFYQACGRTPNHIARACRKHLGCTPGRLVQDARLENAAELLRQTDDEISQVAFESGYNDLAHFYRHFRRRFNTSPGRYRRATAQTAMP